MLEWHPPEIKSIKTAIVSEPDYSHDVYVGRERTDGTRQPARPWMHAAIAETDLEALVALEMIAGEDLKGAFMGACESLLDAVKDQIRSETWQWDRPTMRSDGTVVDSPRDIIDTGELLRGQKLLPPIVQE